MKWMRKGNVEVDVFGSELELGVRSPSCRVNRESGIRVCGVD
jgi:hypothetical protein